jgi:hypothetical protein
MGDRFISQRSFNEDAATLFGTKVEIFSMDIDETPSPQVPTQDGQQQQSQKADSNMVEEENKKMYTALLQNQVLGINNPYLLHEIHNSDEVGSNENLYTQMQRQSHNEDEQSTSPFVTRQAAGSVRHQASSDTSPFNSKFTVLKFNSTATQKQTFGTMCNDFRSARTLF